MASVNKLLYCGSDADVQPLLICQEVDKFIYIDMQPKVSYYQHPSGLITDLEDNLNKHFEIIGKITFGTIQRTYLLIDKVTNVYKELIFFINTRLSENLEELPYYLSEYIVDCNILYVSGYAPPKAITNMMKINTYYGHSHTCKKLKCKTRIDLPVEIMQIVDDMCPRHTWIWNRVSDNYKTVDNWLEVNTTGVVECIEEMASRKYYRAIKGVCEQFSLDYNYLKEHDFESKEIYEYVSEQITKLNEKLCNDKDLEFRETTLLDMINNEDGHTATDYIKKMECLTDYEINYHEKDIGSPLALFCDCKDDVSLLKYVTKRFTININQQDQEGCTVLHRVCYSNNVKNIKYIFNKFIKDIDPTIVDNMGNTFFEDLESCDAKIRREILLLFKGKY